MSDLSDNVAAQLEAAELQKDEEPHKADADHLDEPHGLLTKPGVKGVFGPKGKDARKTGDT